VRHPHAEDVDGRGRAPLVVVAGLEVAARRVQAVGAQNGRGRAVDTHAQHVALVADLVGKGLAHGHGPDCGQDLVARVRLRAAHAQDARRAVVELARRLRRDAIANLDLANDGARAAVVRLGDGERDPQPVDGPVGIPAGRHSVGQIDLVELGPAVLAVGRRDAAGRRGRAGHPHHQRAVAAAGVKVLVVLLLVAGAPLEPAAGNGDGLARVAVGELEVPVGQVKVPAGRAARVESRAESGMRKQTRKTASFLWADTLTLARTA